MQNDDEKKGQVPDERHGRPIRKTDTKEKEDNVDSASARQVNSERRRHVGPPSTTNYCSIVIGPSGFVTRPTRFV